MRGMRLPARLEAALWERSRGWRRRWRQLRQTFAGWRQRWRGQEALAPRLHRSPTLPWPPPFEITCGPDWPAGTSEAMRLVAAVEELDLVEAGWATPGRIAGLPPETVFSSGGDSAFLRRSGDREPDRPLAGKLMPLLGGPEVGEPIDWPFFRAAGGYRFPLGSAAGQRACHPRADRLLALEPEQPGPPTVLFLLPFLAIGGAERLLFDLVASLGGLRVLIVTLEPHQASLGDTVGRARELKAGIYTLGDWLPREAHLGVILHLLRVYRVETLVSWNGTIFFYDTVAAIRREFPELRILAQLFHHEGGFFSRTGAEARAAIDGHLAVNRAIAAALEGELGILPEKIHLLHHGVAVPDEPSAAEKASRRRQLRRDLGLPEEGLVVGSFLRLHPQKRPQDIVALARRCEGRGIHFLLVGGGPLEEQIAAELAARPLSNLVRQPLHADARAFYDAIDLCLLTSAYEGLPVFLLDGLARGIPAVATAVGEVPELLAEGGGTAVAIGDLDALEAAILSRLDPQLRAEEGRLGRHSIQQRFSLTVYAAAYRNILFVVPR